MALAAYNAGYGAVLKGISKYNTNDFWQLLEWENALPWESSIYVPKALATAIVGNNPKAFGFDKITSKSPESYKDRIYVTTEAGERLLPQVIDYLGEDNIMVSEDMPHLEAREGSGEDLGARKDITATQKDKILWRNASRFYGIKPRKAKAAKPAKRNLAAAAE